MRTKKRTLVTSKVYGFNPWMDQLTTINQIMETTGQKSEAPIIRELIDEALIARRRKTSGTELVEQPPTQELSENLHTIQALLLKLIEQGQTILRIESLGLALSQETLAEARAGRIGLWENLAVPALKMEGKGAPAIASLFEHQSDEAKNFAYGLAEELRDELLAVESNSSVATVDDDDRQGRFSYDEPDASRTQTEQAA